MEHNSDYYISDVKRFARWHLQGMTREQIIMESGMMRQRASNLYDRYIGKRKYISLLKGDLPELDKLNNQ